MVKEVGTRRTYDARRRRDQADRTRREVIDVARAMFLAEGYARTTMTAIAAGSNVSVETIYKAFGGKPGLVRAIWASGLQGSGTVPAEQRSDAMQASQLASRQVIRGWGRLSAEVAPLVVPILLLIKSAAGSDPRMAELLVEVDQQRLERMERNARTLYDRGELRRGMQLGDARDVLWTYSSPELYELLVLRRGWSVDRFVVFTADQMIAALLPPAARRARV